MISKTESMICPHCATEMPDISVFCPACGRPANAESQFIAGNRREAVLGAAAYLTIIPAILILAIPAFKGSRFLRFHAWQSIFLTIATAASGLTIKLLFTVMSFLPAGFLVASLVMGLTFLALVILWIVLVAKAIQGQIYELPAVGPFAMRLAG